MSVLLLTRRAGGAAASGGALPAPDYTQLPLSLYNTTAPIVPDWATVASVRSGAAGYTFTDPNTSAFAVKLTSATVPQTNSEAHHDYVGDYVSWGWRDGSNNICHTVLYSAGDWFLSDYRRGGTIVRSAMLVAQPGLDTCAIMSRNSATPRIAYVVNTRTVRKIDTSTNTEVVSGVWPKTFTVGEVPNNGTINMCQIVTEQNDRYFLFVDKPANGSSNVVLWDSVADTVRLITPASIGGLPSGVAFQGAVFPYKDDTRIYLATDTDAASPGDGQQTALWQSRDGTTTGTRVGLATAYVGHSATHSDAVLTSDPNTGQFPLCIQRADSSQNMVATTPTGTQRRALGPSYHIGAPWGVGTTDATKWAIYGTYNSTMVTLGSFSDQGGGIWRCTASDVVGSYGRDSIAMVAQRDNTGLTYTATYTKAASLAALASMNDAWFYDSGTGFLSVRLNSGAPNAYLVAVSAGPPLDALVLSRLDGGDGRTWFSNMSDWRGGADYWATPRPATSPDGLLCMFSSNLGVNGGRTDVILTEAPI
jgi:hypothetical protein